MIFTSTHASHKAAHRYHIDSKAGFACNVEPSKFSRTLEDAYFPQVDHCNPDSRQLLQHTHKCPLMIVWQGHCPQIRVGTSELKGEDDDQFGEMGWYLCRHRFDVGIDEWNALRARRQNL